MIGTNKSISYATPLNLWGRMFKWYYKTQIFSLEEQLAIGVRCFSFEIVFIKDEPYFSNGKAIYGRNVYTTLKLLNRYKTYIELSFKNDMDVFRFNNFCNYVKNTYKRSKFFSTFKNGIFEYNPKVEHRVGKRFPFIWAILFTDKMMKKPIESDICYFDCICSEDEDFIKENAK